ncbi:hypothetical protein [Paenibacillus xylanilyticus]|uniref:hypothetical protein n=1 Tax=Paenibacillus xylanilyticus TaxID=248903 RepID=UPI00399F57B4
MKNQISGQNKESNKEHPRDNPEQFPTEKESLLDQFEEEQTVDPIPLEDLNMEQQEEKNKDQTKSNSSTEEKYRADFRESNTE